MCLLLTSSGFVRANGSAGEGFLRILLVEDQSDAAQVLAKGLREQSYAVDVAATGEAAMELATMASYDAIVLDAMIPPPDGFEVCRRLRSDGIDVAILMLTARDSLADRVEGLDSGADDYLVKPFEFAELLARLRTVKRRSLAAQETHLQIGDLMLDPASREVSRGDVRISLTRTEYNLLERLMFRAGKVVSRRALIEAVWGFDREIEENTLDAFMHLLRSKIDPPGRAKLIQTVRGVGYMIRADGQA